MSTCLCQVCNLAKKALIGTCSTKKKIRNLSQAVAATAIKIRTSCELEVKPCPQIGEEEALKSRMTVSFCSVF